MNSDDILAAAQHEILARLNGEPCESCGRGKDADGVAATALAKIINDLARIKLAEERSAGVEEKAVSDLNPLAALATAAKLPAGSVTRLEIIDRLEGQAIALTEGVKKLRKEERDRPTSDSS